MPLELFSKALRSRIVILLRRVVMRARLFQRLQRDRHARTMRPEHQTEELVRERELIAVDAIIRHQKPARQALLDLAAAVGKRGRGGLEQERVRVAQHGAVEG